MTTTVLCEICAVESKDVHYHWAWFASQGVEMIWRCKDHAACRARVEAKGERWPLSASYDRALRGVRA